MEIKKTDLKWKGKLTPLLVSKVKRIMLHHTAHPTWTIEETHNYHVRTNGWVGIGYNFFIEKDGTICEARGFNIGAGASGYNKDSLHICFAGDFETQEPTPEQIKSGKWLVSYLLTLCSNGTEVVGHKDIGKTACPGTNFPLNEFKGMRRLDKNEKIEFIKNKVGLDDNTMQYLQFYKYGTELIDKLFLALNG